MRGAADIAAYIRNAETDQTTGYSSTAALTFLAWDIFTSFPDEVRLVWRQPSGYLRWLYAFIRYVPLLTELVFFAWFAVPDPTPNGQGKPCKANTLAEDILLQSITVAVELVLLIRVRALYNQSRVLLAVLLAGLAASACASALGFFCVVEELRFDAQCAVTYAPRILILSWLSPVAFDATLFMLTILKFRESRLEGLGKRPILDTMVRDGTWAFVLALVVLVLNAVIFTVFVETLSGIFYFWAISILSFIGSHVLLNLRRIAYESRLEGEDTLDPSAVYFDDVNLIL